MNVPEIVCGNCDQWKHATGNDAAPFDCVNRCTERKLDPVSRCRTCETKLDARAHVDMRSDNRGAYCSRVCLNGATKLQERSGY